MRTYYLQAARGQPLLGRHHRRAAWSARRRTACSARLAARQIRPGVRIAGGELVIGDPAILREQPALLLRVFADAQRHGVPLSPASRRAGARARRTSSTIASAAIPSPCAPSSTSCAGRTASTTTLQEMHELDVLDAFLPEFAHLRCLAQYDRYHIYTVDEHSLRAVERLEQLLHGAFKATRAAAHAGDARGRQGRARSTSRCCSTTSARASAATIPTRAR